MTRRAAARQIDVTRVVRGAIKGGLPVGSFALVVDGARITLLPPEALPPVPVADAAGDAWDRALGMK